MAEKKTKAPAKATKKPATKKAPAAKKKAATTDYVPRLLLVYKKDVVPAMTKHFGYRNPLQLPRVLKIVVNIGEGAATQDSKRIKAAVETLEKITGQKPVVQRARKSIAQFKLREGTQVGCKVTLRGARMYEFLDRLTNIALPRVRDFRGVSTKSFDGNGNYMLGIKEQIVFPEIEYDKVDRIRGMDICIHTSARNNEEGYVLLKGLNMPFRDQPKSMQMKEAA